jgi:hypothetical protein
VLLVPPLPNLRIPLSKTQILVGQGVTDAFAGKDGTIKITKVAIKKVEILLKYMLNLLSFCSESKILWQSTYSVGNTQQDLRRVGRNLE